MLICMHFDIRRRCPLSTFLNLLLTFGFMNFVVSCMQDMQGYCLHNYYNESDISRETKIADLGLDVRKPIFNVSDQV